MTRPARRWTPRASKFTRSILTSPHIEAMEKLSFRADNEMEANALLLATLGVTLEPCCDGEDLCAACEIEADAEREDNAYDHERDARLLAGEDKQ